MAGPTAPHDLLQRLQASLGTLYTFERELGGGGMARVFLATDVRLGRAVVVKVLAPELAVDVSAERFAQEIRVAATLQEPHIVPVLTDGVTSDGLPYYTMPFVPGESLRHRLADGALPLGDAISILRDVARALGYAHTRGIAHRDIKPENVLLSEGTAVVTDFGLAKAVVASSATPGGQSSPDRASARLTGTGLSVGTPAYMSPEQVAGGEIDVRTDLYSWGVVAYELLAGRHPFAHRATAQQLVVAQLTERPSIDALRAANVPEDLASLVMLCLEKDPAHRPPTAGDVLHALDAVAISGARPRPSRALPRTRAARAISVGLAVIIAAATVVAVHARSSDRRPAGTMGSIAVLPFENIGGDSADAYLAHGVTNQLSVTLGRLPSLRVAPAVSARVLRDRGLTAADIARSLDVAGVLTGSVRRGGDRLRVTTELVDGRTGERVWAEEFEAGRADVFSVEDSITHAIVRALRPRLAGNDVPQARDRRGTTDPEAYDLYMHGRYFWSLRSEDGMRRAIDYFSRAAGRDSDYVLAISGLADAYAVSAWYSYVPPEQGYGHARLLARRALALDSTRAEPHASLGYVALYYDWDWPEAERQFRRAIQLDSNYATAHQWYGNYLVASNKADEAIASLLRAQRADPLNRVSVGAVCWGMLLLQHYRDAVEQCGRAIELDSTFGVARLWRGQAYDMLGDTASAYRELDAANRFTGRSAVAVAALAHAYADGGDRTRANALLAELTSPKQHYVPSYEVALVHVALGELDEAFTWLERAYRERSHSIALLNVDPALAPLRRDRRFADLLRRARSGPAG